MRGCIEMKEKSYQNNFLRLIISLFGIFMSSDLPAANCLTLNAPRLAFSSFSVISEHAQDSDTTIDFFCEPAFRGTQFSGRVILQGLSQDSTQVMKNSQGDSLQFGLFSDPARSVPLSSDMAIPVRDVNFDTKTFRVILYGRIYANQKNSGAGTYLGNLIFLLDY